MPDKERTAYCLLCKTNTTQSFIEVKELSTFTFNVYRCQRCRNKYLELREEE